MKFDHYTLDQLVTIKYGKNQKNVLSEKGTIPIYGTGGLMGYATKFLYDKPSVLIGRKGTIGKVKYVDHPFWTVDTLFYTVVNEEIVIPKYLYYVMSQIDLNQYNEGTTIPSLRTETLNRIEFDIPSIADQKEILSYLLPIDEKIVDNTKINDNLYQQAMALFVETFLTFPSEGEPMPLYDFADYINGAAFKPAEYSDDGLPIIKIAELKNGITDSTQHYNGDKGEKYIIHDKDVLFSWSGNPDTSIDVFVWCGGTAILNQHTFNVKSKEETRWFIYLLLKYFKPQFSQIASNKQTTGLGHVTAADLRRLTFPHDREQILSFEEAVSPFMESIFNNMLENRRLISLRDALLPRLMSGEIDVSNVQI